MDSQTVSPTNQERSNSPALPFREGSSTGRTGERFVNRGSLACCDAAYALYSPTPIVQHRQRPSTRVANAPAPICGCGWRGTVLAARPRGRPRCPLALCWWRAPPRLHRAINLLWQREARELAPLPRVPLKPEHLLVASPYVRVAASSNRRIAPPKGNTLRALPIRHHRGAQHRRRDCRRDPRRVHPPSAIATPRGPDRRHRRVGHRRRREGCRPNSHSTTTSQSKKSVRLNRDSLSALSLKRYGSIAFECSREVEGGFYLAEADPTALRTDEFRLEISRTALDVATRSIAIA